MAYGEPTTKKFKHSIISDHIFEPEFQEIFCKNWHGRTPFKNADIEIIAEPFRVCKIFNFLKSEEFMDELRNELVDVKFRRKTIDLYQFEQSNDFSEVNKNNIKTLYHTFQTNLSDWMQKNTKIVLNETVSMSSSCYYVTDFLLCHDDNFGDRRIAFILYLSKNWTAEDGGALDLFDTDEDGLPRNVVKSIIPEYNSIVLFEVAHNSYHQVAEVTAPEKPRWSISGWFHGPVVPQEKVRRPEQVINYVQPENTEVDLSQWISEKYLSPGTIDEIHEDVVKNSFTFLSTFLKESVYERLSQEIQSDEIKWRRVGPADVRNYEVADEDSLPKTLADFCRIFKSITVFQLLKNYTELDLVPEAEHVSPRVTIELQRWSTGCYTLINDKYGNEENVDTLASSDKRTVDSEAVIGDESSSPPETKSPRNNIEEYEASEQNLQEYEASEQNLQEYEASEQNLQEYEASEQNLQEDTPPSSPGDGDLQEEEVVAVAPRRRAKDMSPRMERSSPQQQQLSPLRGEGGKAVNRDDDDFDDSDVSDIGEYLSDDSSEYSEQEDEAPVLEEPEVAESVVEETEVAGPGSLDVIMQFKTCHLDNESIDYVDPGEEDAALIHVPFKDNHLCLVYKTGDICRLHRYVNHFVVGHFYNLVCTYLE